MRLHNIEAGNFKLDGGAMFGVVPKSLWQKTNPADANNMIDMATRCLLIEDGNRLMLIDTGIGNKQSDKFYSYYFRFGDYSLETSLQKAGFSPDDVTDVIFTHLHFDHCGGGIQWNKDKTGYEPTFKNAHYWSNKKHWQWATEPNPREKASFLKENIMPIEESGQLHFLEVPENDFLDSTPLGIGIQYVHGHTESQMLPIFEYKGRKVLYAADLVPTAGHVPLVYVMGYDTRPLITMDEKKIILEQALKENWLLILGHDAYNQVIDLHRTEKGIQVHHAYTFDEVFN